MTLGEIVEAIAKRLPVGRGAEAEARQVRRHNLIAVGDERDEIAESGMRSRNMCDEMGNPCSSNRVG